MGSGAWTVPDARTQEAALSRPDDEYYVPVDPMDDLHCDSCQ